MEKRPNFYTLLELDQSVTEWSKIEQVILAKRRDWSLHKNQGTPGQRRKAERNFKYIFDMETLFKDADSQRCELRAFKQEKKKEKKEQLTRLDELIENIYAETVTLKLVKALVRETGKAFSEKEVERRLKEKGIALDEGQNSKTKATRQKLDTSVAKGICDELNTLRISSLYDFLNLDHSPKLSLRSSPKSLYNRADTVYKDLSHIGKTDPDTTLKMGLAGRAKSVFSTAADKERYDNSYASEALVDLDAHLEIAGFNKFIETKEVESLLKTGKKLGVTESLVMEYIESFATKRKWGIQGAATAITLPLQNCGYCDSLAASSSDIRCKECGEELVQPCPKCGTPTPTDYSACGKCGCHTGDGSLVKSLLREGKQHISDGDFKKAISYLNRALDYWEGWTPAIKEKKLAETRQRESHEELQEIKSLVKLRKMESASSRLEQFNCEFGSSNNITISRQIKEGLHKATVAFDSAEKLRISGYTEQAFDKYEASLISCSDFAPSIAAMEGSPPPAPGVVTATWVGGTLCLTWPIVKARGKLNYVIIRKKNGAPSNRNDGDLVAETSIARLDDSTVSPGVSFYYAIFTVRAKTASNNFAISGPHLLVSEVMHVEHQAGNRQASIKWYSPPGCSEVEVWRREGLAPSRRGEGEKVTISGNTLLDAGLENDRRYGYLVITKYRHPEDASRSIYSNGVSVLVTPVTPPEPIADLKVRRIDHSVFLSWTPTTGKSHVQIRQTQSMPKFTFGQIISINDIDEFGDPIPTTRAGQAQVTLKTQGRIYFVPFSVIAETAVLGEPITITTLDEVVGLKSIRNGNSIILSWQWPQGTTEALITYQHDRYPVSPDEGGAVKERITLAEYERNNHWELRSPTRKKHYFTVFCKDPVANIYSSGARVLEAMGQEATVNYHVVVKRSFITRKSREAWVELDNKSKASLEGVQVVLRQKFPPVSKEDGLIIASANQLIFEEGISKISIPIKHLASKGYIKIFFDNDESVKEVRLLPSRKEKLRLN